MAAVVVTSSSAVFSGVYLTVLRGLLREKLSVTAHPLARTLTRQAAPCRSNQCPQQSLPLLARLGRRREELARAFLVSRRRNGTGNCCTGRSPAPGRYRRQTARPPTSFFPKLRRGRQAPQGSRPIRRSSRRERQRESHELPEGRADLLLPDNPLVQVEIPEEFRHNLPRRLEWLRFRLFFFLLLPAGGGQAEAGDPRPHRDAPDSESPAHGLPGRTIRLPDAVRGGRQRGVRPDRGGGSQGARRGQRSDNGELGGSDADFRGNRGGEQTGDREEREDSGGIRREGGEGPERGPLLQEPRW